MKIAIDEIVGVWEVHAPDAPFPWHMMTFTPYHTMGQSNPHEGNSHESDSTGHGIWERAVAQDGTQIVLGKFVEYKASRQDGSYIGKGVILFQCTVHGDVFTGTTVAYQYDAAGRHTRCPLTSALCGTRLCLTEDDRNEIQ